MLTFRLAFILYCLATSANAADIEQPKCPLTVDATDTVAGSVPPGWTVLNNAAPEVLDGIGFTSGDPSELGTLVGQDQKINRNFRTDQTMFGTSDGLATWMLCTYSNSRVFCIKNYRRLSRLVKPHIVGRAFG